MNESQSENKPIRLQAYLAHAGVASRRACEGIISAGHVALNGVIVTELGTKVLPGDEVRLDGKLVKPETRLHYLALNKPPEYICTSSDPQGRPLAKDLLPSEIRERLYNVGRLDFLSCGLILFTNDGDFAAKVSHPSAQIEKEYVVEATGPIPDTMIESFSKGITIEDVFYKASMIERLGRKIVRVVLVEGKNREIRRVFSFYHLHPAKLKRVRIGPVSLGDLPMGQSRSLTQAEIDGLSSQTPGPAHTFGNGNMPAGL
jgi:23S rRNA pseudouridine2605 synthase